MKSRRRKNCFFQLWRLLRRYLKNSSIHGFKYIVAEDNHWTERLFWLVCCAMSWWGCSILIIGVITDFSNRPVATTVDTNYLEFVGRLPSLHFCSLETPESKAFATTTWPKSRNTYRLMDISTWGHIPNLKSPLEAKAFEKLADLSRLKCELLFERCIWNNQDIDCCEAFLEMWTPAGPCLAMNSFHTGDVEDLAKFVAAFPSSGIFTIYIRPGPYFQTAKKRITLYVMDRLDLPSILSSSEKKIMSKWVTSEIQIDINQEPTYNEEAVRGVAVEKRYCRFTDETEDLKIYKYYSYDACLAEEMVEHMLEFCGCVTHVVRRNPEMPVCDYAGLSCIADHAPNLTDTDDVSCAADCEEITFDFEANFLRDSATPIVHVNLLPGPSLRYRRYIVHSELDLVVSVGSAIGLFVGASVLSLVEIPYWFLVRGLDDDDDDEEDKRKEPPRG